MADKTFSRKPSNKLIDFGIASLVVVVIIIAISMVKNCTSVATDDEKSDSSVYYSGPIQNDGDKKGSSQASTVERASNDREPIAVEILNGVGKSGLAYRIRDHLLISYHQQIDVRNYENATSFYYEKTMIVDRRKPFKDSKIKRLSELTNINTIVYQRVELGVDASIILGSDWELYFPDVVKRMR